MGTQAGGGQRRGDEVLPNEQAAGARKGLDLCQPARSFPEPAIRGHRAEEASESQLVKAALHGQFVPHLRR